MTELSGQFLADVLKLTRWETQIFLKLWQAEDHFCPTSFSGGSMKVHICHLRNKLEPRGVKINTVWGRGYRLPDESVSALREILA